MIENNIMTLYCSCVFTLFVQYTNDLSLDYKPHKYLFMTHQHNSPYYNTTTRKDIGVNES